MRLAEGLPVYHMSGPSPSLEGESGTLSDMQAPAITGSQKTKNLDNAVLVVVMCGLLTSFYKDMVLVRLNGASACVHSEVYCSFHALIRHLVIFIAMALYHTVLVSRFWGQLTGPWAQKSMT